MKTVCFGLLVVFFCNDTQPVVTSDFCKLSKPIVADLKQLTAAELAALERPRKVAILKLRERYAKLCPS